MSSKQNALQDQPCFIDLFAGCGGISLGLSSAGWRGRFAIEKNPSAFDTLATNLVHHDRFQFDWPTWLPKQAATTSDLLKGYEEKLKRLKGKIDLLAGGPPCQGFSLAGRRVHSDPRNSLVHEYIEIVKIVRPRMLLLENVQGFTLPFKNSSDESLDSGPYSDRVLQILTDIGYTTFSELVDLSTYGVPQNRKRFIMVAIANGDPALDKLKGKTPFDLLRKSAPRFLAQRGLPTNRPVTVEEAIFDLETNKKVLVENNDQRIKGFKEIKYAEPRNPTAFVALMRKKATGAPNSLRLPNHRQSTIEQFSTIMSTCRKGQSLHEKDRQRLGLRKVSITPLHPDRPSATVTTLPDDIIHYSEPRILTVRENARLQTFPDWYQFKGNYTSGGQRRKSDCPRYTQVGNAVPPLFSEAIGKVLKYLAS